MTHPEEIAAALERYESSSFKTPASNELARLLRQSNPPINSESSPATTNATVAQLDERLVPSSEDAGSSPAGRTITPEPATPAVGEEPNLTGTDAELLADLGPPITDLTARREAYARATSEEILKGWDEAATAGVEWAHDCDLWDEMPPELDAMGKAGDWLAARLSALLADVARLTEIVNIGRSDHWVDACATALEQRDEARAALAAEKERGGQSATVLGAWHAIFGTTQLTHAKAAYDAALARAEAAEAENAAREDALNRIVEVLAAYPACAEDCATKIALECSAIIRARTAGEGGEKS